MLAAPRISVVIPCYNSVRFLPSTLQSVLAQQGASFEVIVVDDGSTDGSPELVARDFPQVRLLRKRNQGVAAARNDGLAAAKHDWVAFVDADDIWLPGKLAAQCLQLQHHPEAQMGYTAWQVWNSDDAGPTADWLADLQAVANDERRWQGASGWIYPELLLDCVVWTSTVLAQRSLLVELGGFEQSLRIGEDYDLWLRASRVTPIVRLCKPYALYRHHPGNVTRSLPRINHKGEVVARALRRWGYRSPDGRSANPAAVAAGVARSWSDFGGAHLQHGDARTARNAAWRAVRADPRQWLGWKVLTKALVRSWATALSDR